eukprot:2078541-Pleurochrysis_carterae.AAC.2
MRGHAPRLDGDGRRQSSAGRKGQAQTEGLSGTESACAKLGGTEACAATTSEQDVRAEPRVLARNWVEPRRARPRRVSKTFGRNRECLCGIGRNRGVRGHDE